MLQEPGELSFLLVSGDPHWMNAVRIASADLGVRHLKIVRSAEDAVPLLAAQERPYSHLMVQAGMTGDLLAALVGLTAGDARSGIGMVLLGSVQTLYPLSVAMRVDGVADMNEATLRGLLARTKTDGTDPNALSEHDLREALADSRIQARYQPIVRLTDSFPVGLEVLARLEHPTHGIIPPDLFVPRMEAAGMSWSLTQIIVRRAFDDWQMHGLARHGLWIALNFPLDVLVIPEALDLLEAQRAEAGMPASSVVVELTESRPVLDVQQLRRAVAWLRDHGYGVAIDDVGPDLRDASELMDIRFTTLKLDKALVNAPPGDAGIQAYLARTIAAARQAKLSIIAEGVETTDTWARVAGLGVDYAQGFLVARPLPVEAVRSWRQRWCEEHGL